MTRNVSDLSDDERAPLEQDGALETKAGARRKVKEDKAPEPERGPITPAQYEDDDGWGGLPVQMRG